MSMLDPHDHERAAQAAREAWQEMNRAGGRRLWSDWLVIGAGLMALRAEAMAIAGTDRPRGKTYNAVMSALLAKHRLNTISETPRRYLLKIMEHLPEVERWRARQKDPDGLNHPTYVWQRSAPSGRKGRRGQRQRKATLAEQRGIELADMLARLGELEEELRGKQAEIDRLKAKQGDRVEVPMIGDEPNALLRWFHSLRASGPAQ